MSVTEQTAIRDWLMSIGETDSGAIAHALETCERNAGARAYALQRWGRYCGEDYGLRFDDATDEH